MCLLCTSLLESTLYIIVILGMLTNLKHPTLLLHKKNPIHSLYRIIKIFFMLTNKPLKTSALLIDMICFLLNPSAYIVSIFFLIIVFNNGISGDFCPYCHAVSADFLNLM